MDVSAGLLWEGGRLLITRRLPDADFGGLWEFPGGKLEPGESFEAALQRELREELGVDTVVGELIEQIEHAYTTKTVRISFYRCRITSGQPQALGCHELKWVERHELVQHPFPEADTALLHRLLQDEALWAR